MSLERYGYWWLNKDKKILISAEDFSLEEAAELLPQIRRIQEGVGRGLLSFYSGYVKVKLEDQLIYVYLSGSGAVTLPPRGERTDNSNKIEGFYKYGFTLDY